MVKIILPSVLIITGFLFFMSFDEGKTTPYHPGVERSGGPAAVLSQDRTGGPVSVGTCAACHGGGAFSPTISLSVLNDADEEVTSYVPGDDYTFEFTVTAGFADGYGMQGVALNDANAQAGTFGIPTSANTQITPLSGRSYLEHDGVAVGPSYVFSSPWTAPLSGTGNVTIYSIGLAVNLNGSTSGDNASPSIATALTEEEATLIAYIGNPFCSSEDIVAPTITGDVSGSFSADAGLDLDEVSGEVTPATSDFGSYTVTYTYGDETLTTEVTILESYATSTTMEICANDTLVLGGEEFTADDEGDNIISFTAENSCDSVVTLNLIVNPLPEVDAVASDVTVCLGDFVTFTGEGTGITYTWTEAIVDGEPKEMLVRGFVTFTVSGTDINGCSATDEVEVHVSDVTIEGSVTNESVGADGEIGVSILFGVVPYLYDWDNDETGDFDDPQDITDLVAGTYILVVRDAYECEDTRTFVVSNTSSIVELSGKTISVYPNPTSDEVTIALEGEFKYEIRDIKGALIYFGTGADKISVPLTDAQSGTYFLKIMNDSGSETIPLLLTK